MEQQYLDLLSDILENGEERDDRTQVGTVAVFGRQLRFDLRKGFPALTTKKLAWKAVVGELLWFIEGSTDERRLAEITHGDRQGPVTIWTPNALAGYWKPKAKFDGDLGRVYGAQWRDWKHAKVFEEFSNDFVEHEDGSITYFKAKVQIQKVDQLANLIDGIKKDPFGRRHVLSAWNPGELDQMALPPCHFAMQFSVNKRGELSCLMTQRSCDVAIGLPFNIASYALLTHLVAQVCNLEVGELVMSLGDAHIYKNHIEGVKQQLQRTPYDLPKLRLNKNVSCIDDFKMSDIELVDYVHHSPIKLAMAV